MWIFWLGSILILLLLIVLFVILNSKIKFRLKAKKENRDELIQLDVTLLFGLVSLHYEIPAMGFADLKQGLWVESDRSDNFTAGPSAAGENSINKDKVKHWMQQLREMVTATEGFKKWLINTLQRISFVQFDWSTNVALRDAAHTATLTGALWAVKSTIVGWLSYHIKLRRRPKLFVVPLFGTSPTFSTELVCMAEISFGYAVYAGLILIYRVLKVKGGLKIWRRLLTGSKPQ
ncbi:DUF2953 domain-containing protein [Paenibacillus sp. A14]|uniref:DUF2953 domain-containing protein n=1 Tax=Paenibacillus sp. A14 TaxID=3119820 RepID=UPI002FDF71B7